MHPHRLQRLTGSLDGMMFSLVERGRFVGTLEQIAWTGPKNRQLKTMPEA